MHRQLHEAASRQMGRRAEKIVGEAKFTQVGDGVVATMKSSEGGKEGPAPNPAKIFPDFALILFTAHNCSIFCISR